MSPVLAAQNVFGPSTLVVVSLSLTLILLGVRAYVYEAKFPVGRSALNSLDVAIALLTGIFFVLVYLRFRYLA